MLGLGIIRRLQPLLEFLLGHLPLAGSSIANCVNQSKYLIEIAIPRCRLWNGFVQGGEGISSGLPTRKGPYGGRVVSGGNTALQRLRCISGGHAARELTAFGRKSVLQPVQQELFESRSVWSFAGFRTCEKTGVLRALYGGVDFGNTEEEILGNLGVRRTLARILEKLDENDHVLGLQQHDSIIYSLFANSK